LQHFYSKRVVALRGSPSRRIVRNPLVHNDGNFGCHANVLSMSEFIPADVKHFTSGLAGIGFTAPAPTRGGE
jgi:hypothetical protein